MASEDTTDIEVSDVETKDHRVSAGYKQDNGLRYPFDEQVPTSTEVIEVAKGILWARIPLPWSLDHINVYLFDEGDGWSVVDTGARGKTGIQAWQEIEESVLNGKPIKRVIATHMHPDHLGLAGWLVERFDAEFWITQAEYLLAQTLWHSAAAEFPESELTYLFRGGVDRKYEPMIRAAGYGNYKRGVYTLPPTYVRMEDGNIVDLGGRKWRVVIGRGHSPEHACLSCLDEPLFIGGDQILPEITSNVSVYAREPKGNPLAHWLSSLDRMRAIEGDPLVLPSHGRVFFGLQKRIDALIDGHLQKLEKLHAWCEEPRTAVKTFRALYRRKIEGMDFYLALGEAIAHLHLLESLDLLERDFDGEVYSFSAKGSVDSATVLDAVNQQQGIELRSLSDFT